MSTKNKPAGTKMRTNIRKAGQRTLVDKFHIRYFWDWYVKEKLRATDIVMSVNQRSFPPVTFIIKFNALKFLLIKKIQ